MSSWNTESTTSSHDSLGALNTQMSGRKRDSGISLGGLSGNIDFGGYNQHNGALEGTLKGAAIGGMFLGPLGIPGGALIGNLYGRTQISGYDVVGMVGSEVGNMRQAVQEYVAAVQLVVKDAIVSAQESMNSAFRGADAQKAVLEYLAKVKLYVDNLVSQLLSFSDKIADVGNAWIAAQEKIGGTVNTSAGNFSEGSAYVEDVTYSGSTTGSVAGGVGNSFSASGGAGGVAVGMNK